MSRWGANPGAIRWGDRATITTGLAGSVARSGSLVRVEADAPTIWMLTGQLVAPDGSPNPPTSLIVLNVGVGSTNSTIRVNFSTFPTIIAGVFFPTYIAAQWIDARAELTATAPTELTTYDATVWVAPFFLPRDLRRHE